MAPTLKGVDGVLAYLGNPHPCITVQFLYTLGLAVLGLGSPEMFTLLPVPLYTCSFAIKPNEMLDVCEGRELLPSTPKDAYRMVLVCADRKWHPYAFPGAVLTGMRVVVVIVAGLCMDVFGRRRSVVAWMGLYFVVAFSRTFSPNDESVALCVTLEGAAAQAVTLALLLLAAEGSTQNECVRSVCLVILGHAVGMGAGTPLVNTFLDGEVYKQMTRSLPALVFVPMIMMLPGSARWNVCRGKIHEATLILKKSHHMTFDPTMKQKLTTLHEEHKESMSHYGCSGHALRESVVPLVRSGRLLLTVLVFMVCGLAYGAAASARHFFDPFPFSSYEDRLVAFGASEMMCMFIVGLTVTRLAVKRVLVGLMAVLSLSLFVTRVLYLAGYWTCAGFVFVSCFSHVCLVVTGVWMSVGVMRLTPTHSRGLVLGITYGLASVGYILPYLDAIGVFIDLGMWLDPYAETGLWAIVVFVAGLLTLLLPRTPPSLPDTLKHLYNNNKNKNNGVILQEEKPELEEEEEHENTRL